MRPREGRETGEQDQKAKVPLGLQLRRETFRPPSTHCAGVLASAFLSSTKEPRGGALGNWNKYLYNLPKQSRWSGAAGLRGPLCRGPSPLS